MTKGTPMRRDTTDYNLPATLIGSTPYLLAARFLEPEIMHALDGRRSRREADDAERSDGADGGGRRRLGRQSRPGAALP